MNAAKTIFSEQSGSRTAAPPLATATHQSITGCLFTDIFMYLKAREPQCRVIQAPFAVFFKNASGTCLQPDIIVVRDEDKLDDEGCHGAPDWVLEVVSASSRETDYGKKLGIYINSGVREYWIIDPEKTLIVTYCLEHPDVPSIYRFGDIVKSVIYPDLIIDSSHLNQIKFKKAADARDRDSRDTVSSLTLALKKALAEAGCQDTIPAGLIEAVIKKELRTAALQTDFFPPVSQEPVHSAAAGTTESSAGSSGTASGLSEAALGPSETAAGLSGAALGPSETAVSLSGAEAHMPGSGSGLKAAISGLPAAITDPAEAKAFIQEHFAGLAAAKNKSQLLKAAMSALKGRADGKIISEAVTELCI